MPVASAEEFDAWLVEHASSAPEVIVAIFNVASRRQTVGLRALQEVALCHGWVDTQTQRIDRERYAVRFVGRRPKSNWSPKNREMARRMVDAGRVPPAGLETLPPDL